MLLDITKESSDCFPLLKSVLGGVCALIKHYEVTGELVVVRITDADGRSNSKMSRRTSRILSRV